MNYDVVRKLAENEKRHDEQMNEVHNKLDLILSRTTAIETNLHAQPSSLAQRGANGDVAVVFPKRVPIAIVHGVSAFASTLNDLP